MKLQIIIFFLFFFAITKAQTKQNFWGGLEPGKQTVGFKVYESTDKNGAPVLLCMWYPSDGDGAAMKLGEYIETGFSGGSRNKAALRADFKATLEMPMLYNIGQISNADFDKLLSSSVWAKRNATVKKGKWPAILIDSEPSSLCFTNEWFASHGFIVIVPTTSYNAPSSDALLYKQPTDMLELALEYLLKQPEVNTDRIAAFGFGGGSLAAFFLSMRLDKIKAVADIDGGMFIEQTKTTVSADYRPKQFSVPFLHIARKEVMQRENASEFNAIAASPKFRVTLKRDGLAHYDFMSYGRIVTAGLNKRGADETAATAAFDQVYLLILDFLITGKSYSIAATGNDLFRVEKF